MFLQNIASTRLQAASSHNSHHAYTKISVKTISYMPQQHPPTSAQHGSQHKFANKDSPKQKHTLPEATETTPLLSPETLTGVDDDVMLLPIPSCSNKHGVKKVTCFP
jgi:hypothetical protein